MNKCTQIDLEFLSLECTIRKISEHRKLCIMESRLKMSRFTKVLILFIEIDVLEVAIEVAFCMPQQFVYFSKITAATSFLFIQITQPAKGPERSAPHADPLPRLLNYRVESRPAPPFT